jgi:hypothetical protein
MMTRKGAKHTAWIPKKFAKRGKYIRIGDSDGWLVTECYSEMPFETADANSRDYLRTRKASDI